MSYQPLNNVEKGWKTWEPATHEKMFGILGIFQPDRRESAHLEKMTKDKAAKKMGLKSGI